MEQIRFFLPGPSYVPEEARQVLTRPQVGHRSPEFKRLYKSLTGRLQQVLRTRDDVLILTGSSTLAMESAVVSLVGLRVLHLTCGAFSERWRVISQSHALEADRVAVPWGQGVDPELVRQALRRRAYDAVTLVHNETSTGVINPLEEIARLVREESDALFLVDAVSSLAGARVETEAWGLDVVLAGLQKALALPPGISLCSLSQRAAERAETVPRRGFYTDLLRYRKKHLSGGTLTTPAIPQLWALDQHLDVVLEEGMEQRWQRHLELQVKTAEFAAANGFRFASAEGFRSPTVSCLRPPEGVDAPDLVARLARKGFVVGSGYGDWKPTTFRIGHMGEVRSTDLEGLFGAIEEAVAELTHEPSYASHPHR